MSQLFLAGDLHSFHFDRKNQLDLYCNYLCTFLLFVSFCVTCIFRFVFIHVEFVYDK